MRYNILICLMLLLLVTGCSSLPMQDTTDEIAPAERGAVTVVYDVQAEKLYRDANRLREKDSTKAVALYQSAISTDPMIEPAYFNLAKLLLQMQDFEALEILVNLAQNNQIHSPRVYNIFATTMRKQGKFLLAKEYYLKALAIDGFYSPSLVNMAILSDIYLQDLTTAMDYYLIYQETIDEDSPAASQVKNWIADLQLRLNKQAGGAL